MPALMGRVKRRPMPDIACLDYENHIFSNVGGVIANPFQMP
jgi:hypothetical protein